MTAEIEVNGGGKVKHRINGETVLEYEQPQLDPKDADAKKLIKDEKLLDRRGLHRAAGGEPPDRVPQGGDQGAEEVGPVAAGLRTCRRTGSETCAHIRGDRIPILSDPHRIGFPCPQWNRLRQYPPHHLPVHVGEPEVAAAVAERQFLVVDPHQVQDRGVQVVHVHAVLDGIHPEFVGRSVNVSALHSAAGEPHA